jgi:hypothetical protein
MSPMRNAITSMVGCIGRSDMSKLPFIIRACVVHRHGVPTVVALVFPQPEECSVVPIGSPQHQRHRAPVSPDMP